VISNRIIIGSKTGLHARPATQLVGLIKSFKSKIVIRNGSKEANGTSIIHLLALGLKYQSEIEIVAEGGDEAFAMQQVLEFFNKLADE